MAVGEPGLPVEWWMKMSLTGEAGGAVFTAARAGSGRAAAAASSAAQARPASRSLAAVPRADRPRPCAAMAYGRLMDASGWSVGWSY